MEEKILTPDQVAQTLQVHPFTVLKFIKQGKLKASKLGRVYRIRQSDVEHFLDDQQAGQAKRSVSNKNKNDQQVSPLEQVSPLKEISGDTLHLGNVSKEGAKKDEKARADHQKSSEKKSKPSDGFFEHDHYYILD